MAKSSKELVRYKWMNPIYMGILKFLIKRKMRLVDIARLREVNHSIVLEQLKVLIQEGLIERKRVFNTEKGQIFYFVTAKGRLYTLYYDKFIQRKNEYLTVKNNFQKWKKSIQKACDNE